MKEMAKPGGMCTKRQERVRGKEIWGILGDQKFTLARASEMRGWICRFFRDKKNNS